MIVALFSFVSLVTRWAARLWRSECEGHIFYVVLAIHRDWLRGDGAPMMGCWFLWTCSDDCLTRFGCFYETMLMILWPSADVSMILCWWWSDHLLMIPWCCTAGSCDKVRDNLSDCWDLLKFKYLHCMYVRSLTRLMRIKVFYMLKMNTLIDVSSFSWYRISSPKSYYCYLDWEKTVG